MLADVRKHYRETSTIEQDIVRRNLLATRISKLHLFRCRVGLSTLPHAGQGLFATRDIGKEELITCYPGDAVLCWEDADHSPSRKLEVFFGRHVPSTTQNANRAMTELRNYEVPAADTLSILGDPLVCSDAAYLGHMANDGACPDFTLPALGGKDGSTSDPGYLFSMAQDDQDRYEVESNSRVNAEHITVEGSHVVTRALRPINAGDEIFVKYGYGYWLSRFSAG